MINDLIKEIKRKIIKIQLIGADFEYGKFQEKMIQQWHKHRYYIIEFLKLNSIKEKRMNNRKEKDNRVIFY